MGATNIAAQKSYASFRWEIGQLFSSRIEIESTYQWAHFVRHLTKTAASICASASARFLGCSFLHLLAPIGQVDFTVAHGLSHSKADNAATIPDICDRWRLR
jgi:hypothetical protein